MKTNNKKPKTSYKRKFDYPAGSGVHKTKKDYTRKGKRVMYSPELGKMTPNEDNSEGRY